MQYFSVMADEPRSPAQLRWLGAAQLLATVRAAPGITRAAAANRLGISSGSATDLVARLRQARLLDEAPAPAQGRGRPTTLLRPHPGGPLVLAADVRATGWRLALAALDGIPRIVAEGVYDDAGLDTALGELADAIGSAYRRKSKQVSALAVSVAGTVSDGKLVQFTPHRRRDVDLSVLTSKLPRRAAIPVLLCNDATLAGLAEARSGAAEVAGTSLHLIVATGIGGTLVVNGEPISGTHGAAGEYGHIPFGDPALTCLCGARGCWDLSVDGRALARHRGDTEPQDPVEYVHRILSGDRDAATQRALAEVATSLGRGIGGLVNLHDPEVVTLGGVGAPLRAAAAHAFDTAYRDGLMNFRRDSPPPVLDAEHGEEGPLHGAVAMALDDVTSPAGLANWVARQNF
ncbi:ROK family transcriptional regulator [Mycolicibacterium smegmatis]|uniref:ROK-family transcriptional regulator n=3 Tax=Mycolicibacterium smegmatis TaxID=1772 RepID=I7G929_MYCS2|nr:ROK family transcriptional regulator [Mycolicibacterium smegmatis]ABK71391.1 xylose repressor, putative [Mycolicibacterium smegmatis MC2 155]AFP39691.1 ROK-family transcriptional regulator [Mycolicibacterium smegmatis MC2 155]AIU08458.1 XylR family transcriptional regulator [Mycolicibacterium smegmatis MC2 155]AIU15083.1 XylR family transcriptional regulator [Mycolicibacterium smegmatis]AIU21706.1 XylR family transcriptional regulator [Mycolicibacterium smegmatis]